MGKKQKIKEEQDKSYPIHVPKFVHDTGKVLSAFVIGCFVIALMASVGIV